MREPVDLAVAPGIGAADRLSLLAGGIAIVELNVVRQMVAAPSDGRDAAGTPAADAELRQLVAGKLVNEPPATFEARNSEPLRQIGSQGQFINRGLILKSAGVGASGRLKSRSSSVAPGRRAAGTFAPSASSMASSCHSAGEGI
jgi:hypothetical protein